MKRVIACALILLLLLCSCARAGTQPAQQDVPAPAGQEQSSAPAESAGQPAKDTAPAAEAPESAPVSKAPDEKQEPAGQGPEDAKDTENEPAETEPEQEQEPEPDTPTAESGDEPEPSPGVEGESEPDESPAEPAAPYSERTSATVLTVGGSALDREWHFSLYDLQSLGGVISADYFSRGKEPQEATTSFTGVSVQHLLEDVIGLGSYKKVTFTASDGYAGSYSQGAVNMSYINEKDPSSVLWMILAWSEDGAPCALRLVMGQQLEGEYNRTYWVRDVVYMDVKA